MSTATIGAMNADSDRQQRRAGKVEVGSQVSVRRGPYAGQRGEVMSAAACRCLVRFNSGTVWVPVINVAAA